MKSFVVKSKKDNKEYLVLAVDSTSAYLLSDKEGNLSRCYLSTIRGGGLWDLFDFVRLVDKWNIKKKKERKIE